MQFGRLLLALAVAPLAGCGVHLSDLTEPAVVGTGADKQETRTASGFKRIEIRRAIEATVIVDGKESVEIDAKESLMPLVTTKVENGKLVIETTKNIDSTTPVKAVIHASSLDGLVASGASQVSVKGVKGEEFALEASGASRIKFDGAVSKLNGEASGASRLTLVGKATEASIHASGASSAELGDSVVEKLSAEASGASTVEAGEIKTLDANASGASTIRYQGNPQITRSESTGASSVKKV